MSLLSLILGEKKKTASVAKERLQIILAHERSGRSAHQPDYLPDLQRDLIAVLSKYVRINPDDILWFQANGLIKAGFLTIVRTDMEDSTDSNTMLFEQIS